MIVFRSQGIFGVLEFFGQSFTTLQFDLNEGTKLQEGTVGCEVHKQNQKMPGSITWHVGKLSTSLLFSLGRSTQ